jgi:hypothetical protein
MRNFLSDIEWKWDPAGMNIALKAKELEFKVLECCSWLAELKNQFGGSLQIYKIPNQCCYKWHRDTIIGCSLNIVLEEYNCHTIFNKSKHPLDFSTDESHMSSIVELKYEPKKFYLFNSQIQHSVINLDRDRMLVTYVFPKPTTYQLIKDWYINYSQNV